MSSILEVARMAIAGTVPAWLAPLDHPNYIVFPVVSLVVSALVVQNRRRIRKREVDCAFSGKTVWITGASSGIGRALAKACASRGALLIISGRDRARLENTKKECLECWPDALPSESVIQILELDLEKPLDELRKLAETTSHQFSGQCVDVFINNAGVSTRGSISDTTVATDKQVMTINYLSAVALVKGVLPSMIARGCGKIALISSVQGKISIPYRAPYAASKHALQAFADSLRSETASAGLSVTCVSPGYVRTALSMNAITGDGTLNAKMDPTTAAGMSPDALAEQTLVSIANGDPELTVANVSAWVAIYLRTLFPGIFFWAMNRRARKQAQ